MSINENVFSTIICEFDRSEYSSVPVNKNNNLGNEEDNLGPSCVEFATKYDEKLDPALTLISDQPGTHSITLLNIEIKNAWNKNKYPPLELKDIPSDTTIASLKEMIHANRPKISGQLYITHESRYLNRDNDSLHSFNIRQSPVTLFLHKETHDRTKRGFLLVEVQYRSSSGEDGELDMAYILLLRNHSTLKALKQAVQPLVERDNPTDTGRDQLLYSLCLKNNGEKDMLLEGKTLNWYGVQNQPKGKVHRHNVVAVSPTVGGRIVSSGHGYKKGEGAGPRRQAGWLDCNTICCFEIESLYSLIMNTA
jgi:hypothetical protein